MFASVEGYYDGKKIVMEEDVELEPGQEVIVTIINAQRRHANARKYIETITLCRKSSLKNRAAFLRDMAGTHWGHKNERGL